MSDRDLRCEGNVLFAVLVDGEGSGTLEFKCRSMFCRGSKGVVVLHRFDLATLQCETRKYRQPPLEGQSTNGTGSVSASVRSSPSDGAPD